MSVVYANEQCLLFLCVILTEKFTFICEKKSFGFHETTDYFLIFIFPPPDSRINRGLLTKCIIITENCIILCLLIEQ